MHSLSLHGVHSLQVSVYLCVQAVHVWQVVFYLTGSQLTHMTCCLPFPFNC